jgi:hypothetical protein
LVSFLTLTQQKEGLAWRIGNEEARGVFPIWNKDAVTVRGRGTTPAQT